MSDFILSIDQGTTSSRAIVFDKTLSPISSAQKEFPQHFPKPGWVEHDAQEIWQSVLATCREAIAKAAIPANRIAAIGITNQRETTVIWDKTTGKPIHNAIVWQDRRTAEYCAGMRAGGHEPLITQRTGLLLDPYFSASKIAWLLDHVPGARNAADAGKLAFGTIDCFLLWRLTDGQVHATDITNASRTMLLNIHSGTWDDDLLKLFNIPHKLLPELRDCCSGFGTTIPEHFGASIPISGMAGDQQAATIGQTCFKPGMIKATYGTGCFALLNIGASAIISRSRLLTTIAYQLEGKRTYALEGSIFMAGATVQWLRDGLKIIAHARDADILAATANPQEMVYLVPAFVGLGAPWWDADARASIHGLTRNSGASEIARAALEAVAYQTRNLLDAMHADWPNPSGVILRVDGGMSQSDTTMQFLADILHAPVERPAVMETTALGAAMLAGRKADIIPDFETLAQNWKADRRYSPFMDQTLRATKWAGWCDAITRTLSKA